MRLLMKSVFLSGLLISVVYLYTHAQPPSTTVQFSPSKIQPNDGYTLYVDYEGEPYTGELHYDLRLCSLDFSNCSNPSGPWLSATDGVVNVAPNQNLPTGIYMTRFKPITDTEYSLFDVLLIDDMPTVNPQVVYTSNTIDIPPPGSYMIFTNTITNTSNIGVFAGYTRIDIEIPPSTYSSTDPCQQSGGTIMRFTKSRESAYWHANGKSFLRWCVKEENTPYGPMLVAVDLTIYKTTSSFIDLGSNNINVSYTGNGFLDGSTQGLLGGFTKDTIEYSPIHKDTDMTVHYSLLPPDRRIPSGLSSTPNPIVELAFGHPVHQSEAGDTGVNFWHMEALEPGIGNNISSGDLKMRYVETARYITTTHAVPRWSVTEDWVWRQDGLLHSIAQWTDVDPLCWRGSYTCIDNDRSIYAEIVEWYVPNNEALSAQLQNPQEKAPNSGDSVQISTGQYYELLIQKADGTSYSGFLEFQTVANGNCQHSSSPFLWTDVELKPVYVSNGYVKVGPEAYGGLNDWCMSFRVRPYLVNAGINSLYPINSQALDPNASTAAYSSEILTLTIGNP